MLPEMVISQFDSTLRVLPFAKSPHRATWEELEATFGDTAERKTMLYLARSRLEAMIADSVPVAAAWVNGSFVTSKQSPSDIDLVVILNGPQVAQMWQSGLIPHDEVMKRIRHYEEQRYEPGGTATQHLTDFHYARWFPKDHGLHASSYGELEYWSSCWSRVKVESDAHTEEVPDFTRYADCKGFVEVRW
ncbi:MAG: hypothetical protein WBA97_18845 [Actinophytocola sp.]|uniref:DUF6932 family protein n=1 Tax=Actinophytocola sp. TaxID=1872138 RepID=UPI003C768B7B